MQNLAHLVIPDIIHVHSSVQKLSPRGLYYCMPGLPAHLQEDVRVSIRRSLIRTFADSGSLLGRSCLEGEWAQLPHRYSTTAETDLVHQAGYNPILYRPGMGFFLGSADANVGDGVTLSLYEVVARQEIEILLARSQTPPWPIGNTYGVAYARCVLENILAQLQRSRHLKQFIPVGHDSFRITLHTCAFKATLYLTSAGTWAVQWSESVCDRLPMHYFYTDC